MNWREYLKGKKVTVMGLELDGGTLNDIKFLASRGVVYYINKLNLNFL